MADQKLSPQGSPAKSEIPAKAVPGKRAALYSRISTGDQHAETQLYDLRELAKQRRYEIVHEYTDTISGAKSKRPGLDKLLEDARRHRFDVVLVAPSIELPETCATSWKCSMNSAIWGLSL